MERPAAVFNGSLRCCARVYGTVPIAVRAGEAVEIRWELTSKGLEHEVTV
jgi:hypothetical protein